MMLSLNLTLIKNRITQIQTQNKKNHIFKAQTLKRRMAKIITRKI